MRRFLFGLLLALSPAVLAAKDITIAAGTFPQVLESGSVSGGDTLVLARGQHGVISLRDTHFDPPVRVRAAPGARVSELNVRDSSGWHFFRLRILSDALHDRPLVRLRGGRDVVIDGFEISSGSGVERWSRSDWRERARNGIQAQGTNLWIVNNRLRGVYHGIGVSGDDVTVSGNEISWFAGDGIRALASNAVYRGNTIETCIKINDNHDDGIQSWSRGENGRPGAGVLRNVLIEGNVIRSGRIGGLTCRLQGIGFFDGMFENLTVRRNVVVVNHWHGITVMGGHGVRISENLVVDAEPGDDVVPWISITAHKDGRVSRDGLISGNITQPWSGGGGSRFQPPQPGVTVRDNHVVVDAKAGVSLWNKMNR